MSLLAEYFSGERMDSSTCVERYLQGDEATSKAFGVWLQCVAAAVTQLVLNFNPEVVVIGGGMSRIPELFEKLPGLVATQLLKGVPSPPILRARFGDDSGVRGAAIVGALS
jgi:N-acetylglucosamine kinase